MQLAIGVLLLCAAALSANGMLRPAAEVVGASQFGGAAREYLQASSDRSVRFLVVLSAAKAGLAVVEGSTLNVSFVVGASIQLGDIVKALYDAVDYAWTAVLFGCAVLFALRQLLEAGFHVGEYTFAATAIAAAAFFLPAGRFAEAPVFQTAVGRLFRYAATITVVVWVAFPIALILADATSRVVTAPQLEKAEQEVASLRQVTTPPDGAASSSATVLERLRTYVTTKTDDVTHALGTIMAGYALDCVVFPLLFGGVLLGFARRLIGLG
jgi:hypothetical protein